MAAFLVSPVSGQALRMGNDRQAALMAWQGTGLGLHEGSTGTTEKQKRADHVRCPF